MKLEKAIETIITELKEFIGNKKAVIGISGGIDSAVVAALCVKAVGKENVVGISMPYGNNNTDDAILLVNHLGIACKEVNIKQTVDSFNFFEMSHIGKGNIMARTRMIVLYAFANKFDGLVIGTGNKSELSVGYFTKYGDGGVDLLPIGDLYKTEVFDVARALKLPQKIINKKPSADLWEGQTDEGEMGVSYEMLDIILQGKGNNCNKEIIAKAKLMIERSEHKRRTPRIIFVRGIEE
ncbi:MAG: NAD+ synthase [archaeon]